MKNFSKEDFLKKLDLAPWGYLYDIPENEIDNQVTILENIYRDVLDEVAPFKTFRVTRPPTPWRTEEMIVKMNKKEISYERNTRKNLILKLLKNTKNCGM